MREAHRRWHNVTLPLSDPWWNTHRPPNGWRCRCRIVGVTQAEYDAGQVLSRPGAETDVNAPIVREPMQKVPPQDATMAWRNPATGAVQHIPVGIDPGFDYNAGASGRSKAFDDLVRAKLAALGPAVRAAALADGVALREAAGAYLSPEKKQAFGQWADTVLDDGYKVKNDFALVGFVPEKVLLDDMVAQLLVQGVEIHTSDQLLRHGYRANKLARGAALDKETLAALPQKLEEATWYFDAEHGNVVAVFEIGQDDVVGKAVVQFNYARKGKMHNAVITTGVMRRANVRDGRLRPI